MANLIMMLSSLLMIIAIIGANATEEAWLQNVCKGQAVKVAKLHFYIQDALVLDDVVTAKPDPNSKVLGRAQGVITSADLEVAALTMNLNIVFTAGKYNGSTVTILGRNPIMSVDRELPVVGGTGAFRMARGYAVSNTYSYDVAANYGVLEYTVYVAIPVAPGVVASV
ncbi:hypothetical protein BUALT_Bualt15G0012900 [Buddleja alternifolia]|uniref:Dirigent protein n=1 Tax=Buddleja alternifolia TaxID=168488 RepID=A0AAV6WBT6_9LAMI|nr:hypothetical protein BUALT_Bualt15G0012900 [Buddleja alternifolia]